MEDPLIVMPEDKYDYNLKTYAMALNLQDVG